MIPEYIAGWLRVIERMKNSSTYKLAWGRAILECVQSISFDPALPQAAITLDDIASCMLRYYWNQRFFFHLRQGPQGSGEPLVSQVVDELIVRYKELAGNVYPVWFDKAIVVFKEKDPSFYDKTITRIARILPNDVAFRFCLAGDETEPLYEFDKNVRRFIAIPMSALPDLISYAPLLSGLLNYRWSQLLEKYNYQPNIAQKVRSISETRLRRGDLTRFKEALLEQFDDRRPHDFYAQETVIPEGDISIDHVIPWSFMYSDDIWNLVLTTRPRNSQKSNRAPSEDDVTLLKHRNEILLPRLEDAKFKTEMRIAIENDYVDRFFRECRML